MVAVKDKGQPVSVALIGEDGFYDLMPPRPFGLMLPNLHHGGHRYRFDRLDLRTTPITAFYRMAGDALSDHEVTQ